MSRAEKGEPVWHLAATTSEVEQIFRYRQLTSFLRDHFLLRVSNGLEARFQFQVLHCLWSASASVGRIKSESLSPEREAPLGRAAAECVRVSFGGTLRN